MEILKRLLPALAVLALAAPVAAAVETCPLSDIVFTGFVQGRVTVLDQPKLAGPLNDLPDPSLAGGQAETQALIQRLEFKLSSALPWEGWSVLAGAKTTGSATQVTDLWVSLQLGEVARFRAGQFRVPFGIDPQTPSDHLDTVERPLLYTFGNFGWTDALGLEVVQERADGLRADFVWPAGFAGLAPSFAVAAVNGAGRDVLPGSPGQLLARAAVSHALHFDEVRQEFSLGLSAGLGRTAMVSHPERYMPADAGSDLTSRPDLAVTGQDLTGKQDSVLLGADLTLRADDVKVVAEVAGRRVGGLDSYGYYVTGVWAGCGQGWLLDAVARWEEILSGYADGVHRAGQTYQGATLGLTWRVAPAWRVQANYIALLVDSRQHAFPGSDLGILQLQWNF